MTPEERATLINTIITFAAKYAQATEADFASFDDAALVELDYRLVSGWDAIEFLRGEQDADGNPTDEVLIKVVDGVGYHPDDPGYPTEYRVDGNYTIDTSIDNTPRYAESPGPKLSEGYFTGEDNNE